MSLFDCLPSIFPSASSSSSYGPPSTPAPVDLLLLGSGWTGSFVLPLAAEAGLRTASTTRNGANGTISWTFDPESDDVESYRHLPDAKVVLIVFPIYKEEAVTRLIKGYLESRLSQEQTLDDEKIGFRSIEDVQTSFALLGSTGIYDNGPTFAPLSPPGQASPLVSNELITDLSHRHKKKKHHHHHPDKPDPAPKPSPWVDNSSPFLPLPRAVSEAHLLSFSEANNEVRQAPIATTVLNLCGLWGHGRSVRNYMSRLPPNKSVFRNLGSVHLIHGRDVARAIVAVAKDFDKAKGQRWILTNGRVYDLWDLASQFGSAGDAGRDHPPAGPSPAIVQELLSEKESVARALPRSAEEMYEMTGRQSKALDGRQFWTTFGLVPDVGWVF